MEQQTNLRQVQNANPLLKKTRIIPAKRKGDELHAAVKARYALYWDTLASHEASSGPVTTETVTPDSRECIRLDHLPAEILIDIAHYLHHYELNSLIMSSRTLHYQLNNVLYRTYPINSFFNGKSSVTSPISSLPSFVTRINTVTGTPIDAIFNAFPLLIEARIDDFSRPPESHKRLPEANPETDNLHTQNRASLAPLTDVDFPSASIPNLDPILEHAEARAVEISTRFSDNLSRLRALTITTMSAVAFETLLGKCSALEDIELCNVTWGGSSNFDDLMGAMARTVGKTLQTLYIYQPPTVYGQPGSGVFCASIGQPGLFPAFESIRFGRLDVTYNERDAMERYRLLMDLYMAQQAAATGGVLWKFDQEYGTTTSFSLSMMDAACFHSRERLHNILEWLAGQCPVWGVDKCIEITEEASMDRASRVPISIIAFLGENYPVSISYNSTIPPGDYRTRWLERLPHSAAGHGFAGSLNSNSYLNAQWDRYFGDTPARRLRTLNLTIAALEDDRIENAIAEIISEKKYKPTGADKLSILNIEYTEIWTTFLETFLPFLANLEKLVLGPRHAATPFGGYFCPNALQSAVTTLVSRNLLVDFDMDLSGIWHRDVPGGRVFCPTPPIGYSDVIYRISWVALEDSMQNLKRLTLRKLTITQWGDREWFYSIPRRLARLEKFVVIGLVWDIEEVEKDVMNKHKATWQWYGDRHRFMLPRTALGPDPHIENLNLEPEFDTTVDPSCSELMNHNLRKTRVVERITGNMYKAARSEDPRREFHFHIQDIRLFTGREFGAPPRRKGKHGYEDDCCDDYRLFTNNGTGDFPSSIYSTKANVFYDDEYDEHVGCQRCGGCREPDDDKIREGGLIAERLWVREQLGFADLYTAEDAAYDESPEARASKLWI